MSRAKKQETKIVKVVRWRGPEWFAVVWLCCIFALLGGAFNSVLFKWTGKKLNTQSEAVSQYIAYQNYTKSSPEDFGFSGSFAVQYPERDEVGPVYHKWGSSRRFVRRYGLSRDGHEVWKWIHQRQSDGDWYDDNGFYPEHDTRSEIPSITVYGNGVARHNFRDGYTEWSCGDGEFDVTVKDGDVSIDGYQYSVGGTLTIYETTSDKVFVVPSESGDWRYYDNLESLPEVVNE